MITPDREQLVLATGFFNGEGNFSFKRGYHGARRVQINASLDQTGSRWELDQFRHAVGKLGYVRGPYPTRTGRIKWRYQVDKHEHVQAVVLMLWEFLSPVKQQQAMKMLYAWRLSHPAGEPLKSNGVARKQVV